MKHYSLIVFTIVSCMLMISCGEKKKAREEMIKEFRSGLTAEDTTEMLQICDAAMEQLKAKKIDQVLESLYEYSDSTQKATPITEETAKRYRRRFTKFPVLEYQRTYYSFQLAGCNDVKYEVVFATAEAAGTSEPAKTSYMFNPVKVDGDWKLCVKTVTDEIDKTMQ